MANLRTAWLAALHSFSTRISLYIVLIAGLIFSATFVLFYRSARQAIQVEAEAKAAAGLENVVLHIDGVLQSVEVAVQNNAWQVAANLSQPDSMYSVSRRIVAGNTFIVGSAVAFEPEYFASKGRWFSPYSYRSGDKIETKQLGTDNYEYHDMDWYRIPKLLDQPYWSEPYFDEGGGGVIMTTYSYPIHDANGKIYAVITADLSLEWLANEVDKLQLYSRSYNFVLGRNGTYLTHPQSERILNETFFTATADMEDPKVAQLGKDMLAGKSGFTTIYNDNYSNSYVFYAPVERNGWSVATACTYSDIFAQVNHVRGIVSVIAVTGLLFMLFFFTYVIKKQSQPIVDLAKAAGKIAAGDITTPLPPRKRRKDELGVLFSAFGKMQKSLVNYIEELKKTTVKKERIESELRIANEIQMGMLPLIFPAFPDRNDIDLYASLTPAKEVGGDLYDFFVDENKLYFTIGDVSGKGVPASLLMAVTCSLFRTMATHLQSPAAIASSLNKSIAATNKSGMFVTMFIGVLDLDKGVLKFCNAGHNPPVVVGNGKNIGFMDVESNLPLGLIDDFTFKEQQTVLSVEASFFLYTDGLTEAENTEKKLFGDELLLDILGTQRDGSPKEIVEELMRSVQSYANGAEQSDDITMMCFRYIPGAGNDKPRFQKELVLLNELQEISKLAPFIEEVGAELKIAHDKVLSITLALEEALSNVIFYAYQGKTGQKIRLTAKASDEYVSFYIADSGKPFDPTVAKEPDITLSAQDRPIGGLGILLVKELSDSVKYQRTPTENILEVKFRLE